MNLLSEVPGASWIAQKYVSLWHALCPWVGSHLFRRTTALGSLVAFGVLLNVVMLNFCYDVPVKLYSTNLLLMALYLASPDLRRLVDFFVRNRPTVPADLAGPRFSRRGVRIGAVVFQVLFVGYALYGNIAGGWRSYRMTRLNPPRPALYGIWEVENFTRNGHEVPPLVTDTARWRRLIADFPGSIAVKTMDDKIINYGADYSKTGNTLTLFEGADRSKGYKLVYTRLDAEHLLLDGTMGGDALSLRLRRIDISKFLLLNRGFHWINEMPLNR